MQNLPSLEVRGFRVLTTKQIAEAYGTTTDTIKTNFRRNKEKYSLGKHYIELKGEELKELKSREQFVTSFKQVKQLYLWTEKGALLHAKSLNTDKAWEVYDYLVDFYFRVKEAEPAPLLPAEQEAPKSVPALPAPPAPAKPSNKIPEITNPILIFHVLLDMASNLNICVDSFNFKTLDSALHGNHVGIRTNVTVEKAAYELAFELAHAIVHHDGGDLVQSPLCKDYNKHAERIASMVITALNTKMSHLLSR